MNLRLLLWTMQDTGELRHPADVVKALGIRFRGWEAHPIGDQIHLIDVDEASLPDPLPRFLERF